MEMTVLFYKKCKYELVINPCAVELFVSNFHSFEAGIANANSSFK